MTLFFAALALGGVLAFVIATMVGSLWARIGFPLPSGDRRIGRLDGLRGYLALSVMVHHVVIWTLVSKLGRPWGMPPIAFLNAMGSGAVALFFMTTGAVFYPRVLKGLRTNKWPAILITRVFRIIPLVAVSVALILIIIMARGFHTFDRHLPRAVMKWLLALDHPALLGYQDAGRLDAYVLWSLRYEWLFYLLILPACAFAADLIRGRAPSLLIPVGLVAVGVAGTIGLPSKMFFHYLPYFAFGQLAFEARDREWLARSFQGPLAAGLALVGLVVAMTVSPVPTLATLPLYGIFFACVTCGNSLIGALDTRGALVLGESSYGIYILHGLALNLLFVTGAPLIASLPIAAVPLLLPAIAVVVALVTPATYLLVERPMIRLGSKLASAVTHMRVRSTAQEIEIAP